MLRDGAHNVRLVLRRGQLLPNALHLVITFGIKFGLLRNSVKAAALRPIDARFVLCRRLNYRSGRSQSHHLVQTGRHGSVVAIGIITTSIATASTRSQGLH